MIPEIRTPLIQVNNTAHAAWAEENSFEYELKNHFVPARICTLPGAGVGWGSCFVSLEQRQEPPIAEVPRDAKAAAISGKKRAWRAARGTKGNRGRDGVESGGRGELST